MSGLHQESRHDSASLQINSPLLKATSKYNLTPHKRWGLGFCMKSVRRGRCNRNYHTCKLLFGKKITAQSLFQTSRVNKRKVTA